MTTRRMAAIVVVDVVGFSAMMAVDEEGTLATLKAHRTVTDPIILNHGGRIVKTTGDGMLVEVPSVLEAVRAAIEAQSAMARRNAELPSERRMLYRIGINVGDVIVDDDGDVYGDGVNVAARLESLADPGGICVSHAVYGQVAGQMNAVTFADRGEHRLKNIPSPVRVWAVDPAGDGGDVTTPQRPFSPDTTLAVLPFVNVSDDEAQEYFADGITDDLIVALSHDPDLQVVARNSVFALKGQPTDVRTVGRRLDARYVVEGSVRRSGGRVRITAQLVEAETGRQIWADRYDRELDDVFVLQDDIVDKIRTCVAPTVRSTEGRRLSAIRPDELGAWELLQRARWHGHRNTREELQVAIELTERSLALSPSAVAHHDLSTWWLAAAMQGWRIGDRDTWTALAEHATSAYRLDPESAYANATMAVLSAYAGNHDESVAFGRRAVERNPHIPNTWLSSGHALYFAGQHPESVEAATEAWSLGTHEPWRWHTATVLAYAHYLQEHYDAALRWAQEALALIDYLQAHTVAAASLAQLGRAEEAASHLGRLLAERPALTTEAYRRGFTWRRATDVDHFLDGLAAAGLPR